MATDLLERADVLGADAQFDLCARQGRPTPIGGDGDAAGGAAGLGPGAGSDGAPRPAGSTARHRPFDIRRHVSYVLHPARGPMPVLKMMQTNACAKDCYYCPFRAGRDFRREAFTPDELARLTDMAYRSRVVQGLFLSSGVVGHDDFSMERIVATGEILRSRYAFRGYLHLKLMPGASMAAIERAVAVADRVSVNLEAPTPEHLARLTGTKDMVADLLAPLRRARDVVGASGRRVSRTTQYVVGAAGETDVDILSTTARLYREVGLARAYYSSFRPVPDTPLDGLPAENAVREHRLYQADFLLRQYRYTVDDLIFDEGGRLDLRIDPKLAWARRHPESFPVEVNRASRSALLRVPGIGPRTVDVLLAARRDGRLRAVTDLRRLGVRVGQALPWITIDGRRPPHQLPLPRT